MAQYRWMLVALALTLLVLPLAAEAQSPVKVWHIAHLSLFDLPHHAAFEAAMHQLGYVQGQNLVIERRFLGPHLDALDAAMQDVVRRNVDVIVAWAAPVAAAAKRATSAIPIVFIAVRAPVERGLVASLAQPGANVTGFSTFPVETIDPKLFELAKDLLPQLSEVAVLRSAVDPPGAAERQETVARALGVTLTPIPFSNDHDAANAPAAIARSNAQVLIVPDTPFAGERRKAIVQLAAERHLPVISAFRQAVEDGGLMALSTNLKELARRGAVYVDKILKGTKPADLPVEQPMKLELVINLKTAEALGITISPMLLFQADEVIK
jgi:putative tryptophan/tyrosine transport system substrate-binding protein